ncbi:MAG: hypothetical protein ABIE43_03310 [Patescibacteria group bacterium]
MKKLSKYEPPMFTEVDEMDFEEYCSLSDPSECCRYDCREEASNFIQKHLCYSTCDKGWQPYLILSSLVLLLFIVAFVIYKKFVKNHSAKDLLKKIITFKSNFLIICVVIIIIVLFMIFIVPE